MGSAGPRSRGGQLGRNAQPPPPPRAPGILIHDDDAISVELHDMLARKVDVVLSGASVPNVLQMLGEVGGVEVVIRGEVGSEVTFDLRATTVMEALDETLEQAGAEWREVSVVRVLDGGARPGLPIEGRPMTLDVREVPFVEVVATLSEALDAPVIVPTDIPVPAVTLRLVDQPAASIFDAVIASAGLGYEVVRGIEVRSDDEEDEDL